MKILTSKRVEQALEHICKTFFIKGARNENLKIKFNWETKISIFKLVVHWLLHPDSGVIFTSLIYYQTQTKSKSKSKIHLRNKDFYL